MVKRVMLSTDPMAMFALLGGGKKIDILANDEIVYTGLPNGKIRISANGQSKVLKNNLEYGKRLQKYSCDMDCAYVSNYTFREFGIDMLDTVTLESV